MEQYRNSDEITKVLLEFVFDIVIKELNKLNNKTDFQKILTKREMIFYNDTINYKDKLSDYIKFFQSSMFRENLINKASDETLSFFKIGCKESRNNILRSFGMNLDDFDLDLNILQHTLDHSMSVRPVVLTISINDIIKIHNILVSLKNLETDESDQRLEFLPNQELFEKDPDFDDPLYR